MASLRAPVRHPRALIPLVGTIAAATLLMPWLRTGSTRRSALGVIHALRAAGLMARGPAQLFFFAIALVPGIVAAAWLLYWARYPRAAAVTTTIAGILCSTSALTVRHVAGPRATSGTTVALAAGLVAAVFGAASALIIQSGKARAR